MSLKSKKILKIGVTGHRKLTPEQSSALEPVIQQAIENIIYYHTNAYGNISGLICTTAIAEGADTLFAITALKNFDCKLSILLPFEEEEYFKDFKTEEARKNFKFLINNDKVSEIICVNKISSGDRNKLYLETGKKVVDENDYLIAVWNEKKAEGIGGTGDVVKYAFDLGKNILVLNPYSDRIKIDGMYLPEFKGLSNVKLRPHNNENIIEKFYNFYDNAAVTNQSAYKKIWKQCFNIGLITALVFSLEIAFKDLPAGIQLLLNVIGLSSIITITILVSIEKKKSLHKKYLTNRYIAERLRLDSLFMLCGYAPNNVESKVAYQPALEFESLPPLVFTNKLTQLCAYSSASISEKQSLVKRLIVEQCDYHRFRMKKLSKTSKNNSLMTKGLFMLSVSLIIFTILFELNSLSNFIKLQESGLIRYLISATVFLSLFTPALIARFEARKYLSEWERMITQSKYMLSYFEELSGKIDSIKNGGDLRQIINALHENMYLENLEWEIFMLSKNEIPS